MINAIEKKLSTSFLFISNVEKENKFVVESTESSLNGSSAETYLQDGTFYLAFNVNKLLNQDEREKLLRSDTIIKIVNEKSNLVFDFKSFSKISIPLMEDPERFECKIRKYFNEEIKSNKKQYFRTIIPTKRALKPGGIFETESIKIGSIIHYKGLLKITFNNSSFHLYTYNSKDDKNKNYLMIESLYETNFDDFIIKMNTVLISYAFITGYYPRDAWYIISAHESDFEILSGIYYETLPKSLESSYSVFPSSEYRIYFRLPQRINFPQNIFNNLCTIIHNNDEFARVLYLLVEGHTLSTELKGAIYSIALESITNIISEKNQTSFTPIPNKKLAKKIVNTLKSSLTEFRSLLEKEGLETLNKKLDVINSPTNKQKLIKPFELLGIILNNKEIECINKRNDYLHGRIPNENNNETQKYNLEQTSLTILYCVTALVLKSIGYSGYIMYYPTLNEFSKKQSFSDYLIKYI